MTGADITSGEALTIVLTVQSLLFAALSIAAVLGEETEYGRALPTDAFSLAMAIALVVSFLGLGAVAAWWDAFITPVPKNIGAWITAVSIPVATVAESAFAWWIALAQRDS
ncbi:MAG TPA: hypothetical protein VEQ41_07000 [Solirubrobacterales bacterium]|nr:hypothetical protein [Solirubrobacterales bacterium]